MRNELERLAGERVVRCPCDFFVVGVLLLEPAEVRKDLFVEELDRVLSTEVFVGQEVVVVELDHPLRERRVPHDLGERGLEPHLPMLRGHLHLPLGRELAGRALGESQTPTGTGEDDVGALLLRQCRHPEREAELKSEVGEGVTFVLSNPKTVAAHCRGVDLLIGAVLRRGARAPMIVTEAMVETMQPGAVIVDVSIDQGGCVETARPTTHARPVYREHGVIHYCVANMPGAYPRTSTVALTDATMPYVMKLADQGVDALRQDKAFAKGVNVHGGHVCCRAVAEDLDLIDSYRAYADIDA